MRRARPLRPLLALCVALSLALPGALGAQGTPLRVPVVVDTLPNGLTLIIHEDRTVPIVTTNVWYHVGSGDEKPGRTGFAHLFEHLMFMGSKNAPYPQFDRLLEAAGANNNGSTTGDRTNYYESGPASALPLMLWLEADRLGWMLETMDAAKVDLQRDVVKNERRQSYENQPYGLVTENLLPAIYPAGHPYSWSTIGSMADLSAASVDDVKDFFRTYYAPNNASIVVAGAVNPDSVRRAMRELFAEIPRGPAITRPAPAPFTVRDTVITLEDRVQLPRLYLAWHGVKEFSADDAALDIASYVLAGARNARLTQALVYEREIATSASAFNSSKRLDGDFQIVATARPGFALDTLKAVIDGELRRLAASGPSARELGQAMNAIEAQFLNRLEFSSEKADQLNAYYYATGTPDFFQQDLERYRKVTAADVQRVVRQYLTAGRVTLSVVPQGKKELAATPLATQEAPFDRTRPPALTETPALTIPVVRTSRLPNGPALHVVEQRELPLVQITLSVAGGGRLDRDLPGLATFAANLMDEGAGTRDANALQSELAFLGASLSVGATWDATTVSLKVARRNLEAALDLMADVVLRPTFAANEVRRQRDLRLASLLQQKDQPAALANLAFTQALFPTGHPYRNALGGDSAGTARLDSALVRDFHRGSIRPERATFYVVGDLSADDAQRLLGTRFRGWTASGPERRPAPVLVTPARPQGLQVILVDKPGAAQSVVIVGTTGIERTSGDYAAVEVMNTILGGSFSSRLMTNLRETRGYTYGVGSGFAYRPLPGPFSVSSSVRTDVTDSSLVELFKELRAIRETPVSAEELARAMAYIRLAVPGDLETSSQIAGEMAFLANWNLPLEWLREYVDKVGTVTAADVQRVARQLLPSENAYVVVVGDLARIRRGIDALALGPVTVREVGAIARE